MKNKSNAIDSELTDLEWLAVQYLAGELDEVACQAFEQRLEIEPAAQVAVVAMMQLLACVDRGLRQQPLSAPPDSWTAASVDSPTTLPEAGSAGGLRQTWSHPIVWLASVAATLMIGLTIWQVLAEKPAMTSSFEDRLAVNWVNHVTNAADMESDMFDDDELPLAETDEFVLIDETSENWLVSAMGLLGEDELDFNK